MCDSRWQDINSASIQPGINPRMSGHISQILLRFKKSLPVAGVLTVPVYPGLLLRGWRHLWRFGSLSRWLPLPLCPPSPEPSWRLRQWLSGRKEECLVSKVNVSSHLLGQYHLEWPLGRGRLPGSCPGRAPVGCRAAKLLEECVPILFCFSQWLTFLQLWLSICSWVYCLLRLHFPVNGLILGLSFLL